MTENDKFCTREVEPLPHWDRSYFKEIEGSLSLPLSHWMNV